MYGLREELKEEEKLLLQSLPQLTSDFPKSKKIPEDSCGAVGVRLTKSTDFFVH